MYNFVGSYFVECFWVEGVVEVVEELTVAIFVAEPFKGGHFGVREGLHSGPKLNSVVATYVFNLVVLRAFF